MSNPAFVFGYIAFWVLWIAMGYVLIYKLPNKGSAGHKESKQ